MLPASVKTPMQEHLKRVKARHEKDLADGWGRVLMPDALDRKYPNASKEWRWQRSYFSGVLIWKQYIIPHQAYQVT